MNKEIEACMEDPEGMEALYRKSPETFIRQFDEVFEAHPTSTILHVWYARLAYEKPTTKTLQSSLLKHRSEILLVALLCLIGGTLARIPAIFTSLNEELFVAKNLSFFVLPGMALFFLARNVVNQKLYVGLGLIFAGAALYMNLLPFDETEDTFVLAAIHLPFLLWAMVGVAFAGKDYRGTTVRMDYLKFNGEMIIYTLILLAGGVALTGGIFALFQTIGIDVEDFLVHLVVYGGVSSPIVATYLTVHRSRTGQRIAPAIARIFSPLVLVTLLVFLIANLLQGKSPYTDRDFLIVFNLMLFSVLAIAIFTISERPTATAKNANDYIAFALVTVALLVDFIALSAILFRLTSYGLTPNRFAVLGANLLVFGNLAGIVVYYARFLKGKVDMRLVENWITRYLPLYVVWTAFIVFVIPFLFGFN